MSTCVPGSDWQPVIIALAAAIPTLVVVIRNHFTLSDVASKQDALVAQRRAADRPEVPHDPA